MSSFTVLNYVEDRILGRSCAHLSNEVSLSNDLVSSVETKRLGLE